MATERIGKAILELATDSAAFRKDIEQIKREATTSLPNAFKQARGSLDALASGMSAAGKEASASSKLIAGMSSAGSEAAKGLGQVSPQLQLMQKGSELLKGSWVSMTASFGTGMIIANVVSSIASSIGEAVAEGARLPAVSKSFDQLTASVGQSGAAMLSTTRTATKGLISDLDIMQSSNKALLLGLPVTSAEMGKLGQTATVLGRAMGQDATKSLDDLITALGRSSPLILDNLGLTVKAGEANEKYAQQLGKPVDALTDAEKKTAFYNAAMDAATEKVEELGGIHLTVTDQVGRLGTTVGNLVAKMAAGVNESGLFSRALGTVADAADRAAQNMEDLNEARRRYGEMSQLLPLHGPMANAAVEQSLSGIEGMDSARMAAERRRLQDIMDKIELERTLPQRANILSGFGGGGLDLASDRTDFSKNTQALVQQTDELAKKLEKQLNPALLTTKERMKDLAFLAGEIGMAGVPAVENLANAYTDELVPATQLSQEMLSNLILTGGGNQASMAGATSQNASGGGGKTIFSNWETDVERLADSFLRLAQVGGGPVVQSIGSVIAGVSTAKTGFESLQSGIGKITSGSGLSNILGGFTSIVGGIGGIVGAASAAVAGIRALFSAFQSEETRLVNKPRDAFFDQYGGYEGLAQKLTAASDGNIADSLIKNLYAADTEKEFHSAEDAIIALIGGQKFAKGGIAMRPLLGMVGDNGPEAVLPLSRLAGMNQNGELADRMSRVNDRLASIERLLTNQPRMMGRAFHDALVLSGV